jgi:hypothetical protein
MHSKRSVPVVARLCISSALILALIAFMAPLASASSADRSSLKNFRHVIQLPKFGFSAGQRLCLRE